MPPKRKPGSTSRSPRNKRRRPEENADEVDATPGSSQPPPSAPVEFVAAEVTLGLLTQVVYNQADLVAQTLPSLQLAQRSLSHVLSGDDGASAEEQKLAHQFVAVVAAAARPVNVRVEAATESSRTVQVVAVPPTASNLSASLSEHAQVATQLAEQALAYARSRGHGVVRDDPSDEDDDDDTAALSRFVRILRGDLPVAVSSVDMDPSLIAGSTRAASQGRARVNFFAGPLPLNLFAQAFAQAGLTATDLHAVRLIHASRHVATASFAAAPATRELGSEHAALEALAQSNTRDDDDQPWYITTPQLVSDAEPVAAASAPPSSFVALAVRPALDEGRAFFLPGARSVAPLSLVETLAPTRSLVSAIAVEDESYAGSFFAAVLVRFRSLWHRFLNWITNKTPSSIDDLMHWKDWITAVSGMVKQAITELLGVNTFPQATLTNPPAPDPSVIIGGNFQGGVYTDGYSRYRAADDFGHSLHEIPAFVARPEAAAITGTPTPVQLGQQLAALADSVKAVIDYARAKVTAGGVPSNPNCQKKIKVAARGADIFDTIKTAHSVWGQSQVLHGIVIDVSQIKQIFHWDTPAGDKFIRIGAGATWKEVVDYCQTQVSTGGVNYCTPITTSNLFLTVGGTLSILAGEYTTTTQGAGVCFIEEMTVVTGTGQILTCSRTNNPDLYDAVRCGIGEYGIIVDVTYKLIQQPPVTYGYLAYTDYDKAMKAIRLLNRHPSVTGTVMEVLSSIKFSLAVKSVPITITAKPWQQMIIRLPSPGIVDSELRRVDTTNPSRKPFIYFVHAVCYAQSAGSSGGVTTWNRINFDRDVMQVPVTLPGQQPAAIPAPVQKWVEDMSYWEYKRSVDAYITVDQKFGTWNSPHAQVSAFMPGSKVDDVLVNQSKLLDKYKTDTFIDTVLYLVVAPYRPNFTTLGYGAPGFMLPDVAADGSEDIVLISTMFTVRDTVEPGGAKVAQKFAEQLQRIQQIVQQDIFSQAPSTKCFPWGWIPYPWTRHYGTRYQTQQGFKTQFDPDCILGGADVFDKPELV